MIFLTKILAIAAATSPINTIETENITTHQQEHANILHAKERLMEKIAELRHEIEKINRYYQDVQSGTADIFELGESVDHLTAWVKRQKSHVSKLAHAIEENAQSIENKSKFIESLSARVETLGEKIRLKKIEIESLKNPTVDAGMSPSIKTIIQKKQEEKKSVLAKIRVINKRIKSSKIKIDTKTEEIMVLKNKFNKSIEKLEDINSAIQQCPSNKQEALLDLHELFASSINNVGLYNSYLIDAQREKIQLESELEHFWVATAFKKIEYKNRVKVIKKEIQEQEEKQSSSIDDDRINNLSQTKQLHELLVSSEILYQNMLNEIKAKKEEITFYKNNHEKLKDSFATHDKKLALVEEKLANKIKKLGTWTEEMRQNMINHELEKLNNVRNSLIQEKHGLEKELAQLSDK